MRAVPAPDEGRGPDGHLHHTTHVPPAIEASCSHPTLLSMNTEANGDAISLQCVLGCETAACKAP